MHLSLGFGIQVVFKFGFGAIIWFKEFQGTRLLFDSLLKQCRNSDRQNIALFLSCNIIIYTSRSRTVEGGSSFHITVKPENDNT